MKKAYPLLLIILFFSTYSFAQRSAGGFPWSSLLSLNQDVPLKTLETPEYAAIRKKDKALKESKKPSPYRVAKIVQSDIDLNNSGRWTYLENGDKIWQLKIKVPEAKGVAIKCDTFYLPKGVKLFLSNNNSRQILGAYTYQNVNHEFGRFITGPVQGHIAILEMDIPKTVSVRDIAFHINGVPAYYRGVNYLSKYAEATDGVISAKPTASSAICQVDANCSLPTNVSSDYNIPKKATVQIIIPINSRYVGLCSGTLINNTGNSKDGTCIPLLLTASHCEQSNSFSNSGSGNYDLWRLKYNYRHTTCGGSQMDNFVTLIGVTFKARSFYPSMTNRQNALVQDFLLVQPNIKPTNVFYAGWNRGNDFLHDNNAFFIGFHHPHGDVEKMSYGTKVLAGGTFNQNSVPGTHWFIRFTKGGVQEGSSGSGLFDKDGLLIGDLSGGGGGDCPQGGQAASDFGTRELYSKLGKGWENGYDQTNHSFYAGSRSQLKDWLDPTHSGVTKLEPMTPECKPMAIEGISDKLNKNIKIYPTPSETGIILAKTNFSKPRNFVVKVYNTIGQQVKAFTLKEAYQGQYGFDCSSLSNGIYWMKFIGKNGAITKKVIITR